MFIDPKEVHRSLFCSVLCSHSLYIVSAAYKFGDVCLYVHCTYCTMLSPTTMENVVVQPFHIYVCRVYEPIKLNRSIKYDKLDFFQATKICVYSNKMKTQPQSIAITSVRLILCHNEYVYVSATVAGHSDERYTLLFGQYFI